MAFIIKPLVTENMTKITDKQPNRYGFVVRPEANKLEIKTVSYTHLDVYKRQGLWYIAWLGLYSFKEWR